MKRIVMILKRSLPALLALLLLLSGVAAEASAPADAVKQGDVLCFGEPDADSGFDGKWLVLDPAHTSMGTDGMFLASLNLVGADNGDPLVFRSIDGVSVSFSDRGESYASAHPGATDYQGSDLQQWCERFSQGRFSAAEREALIPTFKSDSAIVISGLGLPLPGAKAGTVDFDPAENVLSGDRIFTLSVAEITNESYGFSDDRARVAFYKGEASGYWLRSPHIPTFPLDVGFVFSFGAVMDYPVNASSMYQMTTYARPACNLDSARISALEKLSEQDGVVVWRVSFEGEEANARSYDDSLPAKGKVMDLKTMFTTALVIVLAVVVALISLLVWLVVRLVKKRKARR